MACLNDVLVSATLNELVVVCDLLLVFFFPYSHFMAYHEVSLPCILDMYPWHKILGITQTLGISG